MTRVYEQKKINVIKKLEDIYLANKYITLINVDAAALIYEHKTFPFLPNHIETFLLRSDSPQKTRYSPTSLSQSERVAILTKLNFEIRKKMLYMKVPIQNGQIIINSEKARVEIPFEKYSFSFDLDFDPPNNYYFWVLSEIKLLDSGVSELLLKVQFKTKYNIDFVV